MKVLHIDAEMLWRGGQQQAIYLFEGMLALGYDTSFICRPQSALHSYLIAHKLPHYAITFRGEGDILAAMALVKIARKEKVDILHLHSSHALSWGLLTKAVYPSVKLIAARRVDFAIGNNLFSRWKYSNPWLNQIVAISENIRQVLLSCGIADSKITLIHSGVDTHKFDDVIPEMGFREKWTIPSDAILIGTVAAFVGHKDYPNLIHAAAIAAKANPQLHFIAVGDGALLAKMQELAKTLGLDTRFTFTGYQKEVGKFLKSCDIFVLASKKEGLGTSVIDAMSCALPVIGTRAGGIAEMVQDQINGLLVPARDSDALASAMLKLASDDALRAIFGKNAAKRALDFSKERMINANLSLYSSL